MTTNANTNAKRVNLQQACHELAQRAKSELHRAFAQTDIKILVVDVPKGFTNRGPRRKNPSPAQSEGSRIYNELAAYFGEGVIHERVLGSDIHALLNFDGMSGVEISLAHATNLFLASKPNKTTIHLFLTAEQVIPDATIMAIMFGIDPDSWRIIDADTITEHLGEFQSDRIGEMEYWLKKHLTYTDPSKLRAATDLRGKQWWPGAEKMLASYMKADKKEWEIDRRFMKAHLASVGVM